MAKPVHSMIRVLEEQRSLDFYRRAFSLAVVDRFEFDAFVLIYLKADAPGAEGNTFELELTVNKDRKEPYALGDGYGHLAVVVDVSSDIRNPSRGDTENPSTSATVMPRRMPVRVSP